MASVSGVRKEFRKTFASKKPTVHLGVANTDRSCKTFLRVVKHQVEMAGFLWVEEAAMLSRRQPSLGQSMSSRSPPAI